MKMKKPRKTKRNSFRQTGAERKTGFSQKECGEKKNESRNKITEKI